MKQVLLSMGVVAVAAGILAGMVIYTVSLMRQCQLQLLTGVSTADTARQWAEIRLPPEKMNGE